MSINDRNCKLLLKNVESKLNEISTKNKIGNRVDFSKYKDLVNINKQVNKLLKKYEKISNKDFCDVLIIKDLLLDIEYYLYYE